MNNCIVMDERVEFITGATLIQFYMTLIYQDRMLVTIIYTVHHVYIMEITLKSMFEGLNLGI